MRFSFLLYFEKDFFPQNGARGLIPAVIAVMSYQKTKAAKNECKISRTDNSAKMICQSPRPLSRPENIEYICCTVCYMCRFIRISWTSLISEGSGESSSLVSYYVT